MIANFKDPEGCSEFRILLQDFDNNIKNILKEKKKQAAVFEQSMQLFDMAEKERKMKFKDD